VVKAISSTYPVLRVTRPRQVGKTTLLERVSDQKEIDLIIEDNGKLQPIEIKKSANPKPNAVRHFSVLRKWIRSLLKEV